MPKAELHLHLDGSLRPATALELARARALDEGLDLPGMEARLTAPSRCADQAELLRAFDLPIALLQDADALERAGHELVEDVAADGTRYVEIRWAPALHTARGLSLDDVIASVARGTEPGAARAGVVARLIAVALRSHDPRVNEDVARAAARFADRGVTGFDLAGPEQAYPDPLAHRRAFEIARDAGLGVTVHAGEWGGAPQVRRALELGPRRIAHGAPAVDDGALVAELIGRDIALDLAPTSNVQAGLYADIAHHPLARLARAGVPVTLSTDDRTVSALTLTLEYENVHRDLGIALPDLWAINRRALDVAFLHDDEATRDRLRAEFDAFATEELG